MDSKTLKGPARSGEPVSDEKRKMGEAAGRLLRHAGLGVAWELQCYWRWREEK
jgi:hypothetical protein